jgi:hypothetical protein
MRKTQDDPIARNVAENKIADITDGYSRDGSDPVGMAEATTILGEFEAVEFETTISKVRGGQEIPVRRLVITGPWEVDLKAK